MPIIVVSTTRRTRIFRAGVYLFLCNLLFGGGLGLFVEHALGVLPNDPFIGIGIGIVLANLGTFVLVRALYKHATRVAAVPDSLADFLDNALYALLGIEAGFPIAAFVAGDTWKKLPAGTAFKSDNLILVAFGIVALAVALHSTKRLVDTYRRGR